MNCSYYWRHQLPLVDVTTNVAGDFWNFDVGFVKCCALVQWMIRVEKNKTKRWRMMALCDNLTRWLVDQWHQMIRWARNAGWIFFERLCHFPRGYLITFRCNKRVKQTVYSTRHRDGTARLELSTRPSLRGSIWFSTMSLSSSNGGLYGGFSEDRKERKCSQWIKFKNGGFNKRWVFECGFHF